MNSPTNDQVKGIIERVAYGLIMLILGKLVARGVIDGDMAAYIAGGAVTAIGGAYAWWVNRPKAIVQSAAALPGTTVLTTHTLATSTPEGNIVSADTNKVVNK